MHRAVRMLLGVLSSACPAWRAGGGSVWRHPGNTVPPRNCALLAIDDLICRSAGSDFADLTDQDMKDDLGMTGIQIKKIRAAVAREMGGVAAAPAAAAVAAAAPVAAAPYVAAAAVAAAPMAAAPMAAAPMMAAPVVAAVVVDREMVSMPRDACLR